MTAETISRPTAPIATGIRGRGGDGGDCQNQQRPDSRKLHCVALVPAVSGPDVVYTEKTN